MSIPLPSPFTIVGMWMLAINPDDKALVLLLVLGVALILYFILTAAHGTARERILNHYKSATEEHKRHLPAVKEREGDSDSAWTSEYTLSIDRCVASACLALDALDHDWPWTTAEVRKTVSQADKFAAIMRGHSSVARRLYVASLRGANTDED